MRDSLGCCMCDCPARKCRCRPVPVPCGPSPSPSQADVFCQRLKDEYGADVISTVPTVPYRVVLADGSVTAIRSPSELPDAGKLRGGCLEEPMVNVRIIAPKDTVGALVQLCVERRGVQLEHTFLDEHRAMLRYFIPMGEMAVDFADVLKRRSTGYASFDYEPAGYQAADIVRLDLLINGEPVDALATLVHRDKATRAGREMASRLKELLGRQMYDVAIQVHHPVYRGLQPPLSSNC